HFPEVARRREMEHWMAQLTLPPSSLLAGYNERGAFLNADLLLWCELDLPPSACAGPRQDLLAVDTSTHGLAASAATAATSDLEVAGELLRLLEREVAYLQQKSAFTRIAIETGESTGPLFSAELRRYLGAVATSDKESY